MLSHSCKSDSSRMNPEQIKAIYPVQTEPMTDPSAQFHRQEISATDEVTEVFAKLSGAFPTLASFQGLHFKYAVRDGVVLIESKRDGRYFYWILIDEKFLLIHASLQSKLKRMETITNATFIPSRPYDQAPNA